MRLIALLAALLLAFSAQAAIEPAPERSEGEGPFDRLILRGATLINSTGAPPMGPVDIVIEGNRIVDVHVVGYPGVAIDPAGRPEAGPDDRELDLEGHYVLPGFVDMHAHIGGRAQGTPAEYVFKLWLAHGITTIREPGSFNGLDWVMDHKRRSDENRITAPRIHPYVGFGQGHEGPITTQREARRWVRRMERAGAEGFKFFGSHPDILRAAIEEATERGLGTAQHHAQLEVGRANVLDTARWGLTTMEHWYGLPEALFEDRTLQDYRRDYNYQNEYHRFAEAGTLWRQAAEPGSEHWRAVRDELIALDFTINPTLNIYEANRDFMAQRRAEWHEAYTLPSLWNFFEPDRRAHGSYWFDWTTQDEINWRENYRLWMQFLNDYKNHGGRVTLGSDSGYIYKIYGFGYIQEMELLQEAGFHPLEVIRAATLHGAEAIGRDSHIGSIEPGKLADLVVVGENPLQNFKVLYGTGAIRVDDSNRLKRVGGVRYTIKDGIIYDAEQLRADVREMVRAAKEEADIERLTQPAADY
ncbi:amidohydrolase family protein [Natronospira bacteriovora]|uniref:Amidohydrolase family protein n=1 Tax=Natronospira bacteriovora TaxID=3069753 RepID=A0ABU0WAQ0_9GAMM|nr:amidohydrolase family protein [Natronospira sp. AB-CW4]MDQ2070020.1 amidohydrolase family protein [Natronospira sp. AB-CW4]